VREKANIKPGTKLQIVEVNGIIHMVPVIPRMVIMRMKAQTTIRVDQENYLQAKEILKYLGLTYSQAINVFNNMIVCHNGLPFEIKIPNDETLAAMSEADQLNGDFVSIDDDFVE